jgi:protoheme IX farnesyltransferase
VATVALVVVSLLPYYLRQTTVAYALVAAAAGLFFIWRAMDFLKAQGRDKSARRLFLFSLVYLPVVLGSLVADRLLAHAS